VKKDPSLFKINATEYGSSYKNHLLIQYKLYVQMADNISQRREAANNFLLAVNSGLLGIYGGMYAVFGTSHVKGFNVVLPVVGLLVSLAWFGLLRSYRQLNTLKFRVIHQIESELPIAPYEHEWKQAGHGDKQDIYFPLTHVEPLIPIAFGILYFALILFAFGRLPFCPSSNSGIGKSESSATTTH
jgi:hypothetical protein